MTKRKITIVMNLARGVSKALLEESVALLVLMALCVIETAALMEGKIYTLDVPEILQQLKGLVVLIILVIEGVELVVDKEKEKVLKIISLGCASVLFFTMKFSVGLVLVIAIAVLFLNLITFIFEKKIWRNRNEKEKNLEKSK